jgi:hypothetical protein
MINLLPPRSLREIPLLAWGRSLLNSPRNSAGRCAYSPEYWQL